MKLAKTWALAALVTAAPVAVADDATAIMKRPPPGDPKITFEHYKLANGLDVILAPDPGVPLVAVNVWYHVGSGHEVHGKSGFAHLFEHMMFQGSKHVGEDRHFEVLKKIGVDTVNGTTNTDRTNYFEVVPSNQIETALWLESDRMGWLLDLVTKKSLENQIEVVRNERRQNYDNRPYGKALFAEYKALYPEGHPYRHLTIGKHEDLVNASEGDVKGFFKTWYIPANATLTISGDFDLVTGKQLVDRWFGTLPASEKPAVVAVPAPVVTQTEVRVTDDPLAKLGQVIFAWHSPASYAAGDAELDILADVLSREGPGRLYRALVYDRPLAQSVRASQAGRMFSGVFEITVTLRGEASVDEVKQIVLDEVARVRTQPLVDKEIQRVIARNEAAAIRQLETVLGRSQVLQAYNHYLGDPGKLSWDLDRYRTTTAEAIRAAAAKYLTPGHAVTVITVPQAKGGK
ncbi:MAG TPA: pitrilysin family protein [Kofleriaceae bacterium]|jgi:predicted Zn-dependent peptidase|nr:pitrilysin family protein [Kofleriaceae bacterium]